LPIIPYGIKIIFRRPIMATKKTEPNKKVQPVVGNDKNNFAKFTREQLSERFHANIAERKRLSEENKILLKLWKETGKNNAKPVSVAKATANSTVKTQKN
jgi:hypothetical protein